jgi:hypothetical protein
MNNPHCSLPRVSFDHLTINTGHNCRHELRLSDHLYEKMRPLTAPGFYRLDKLHVFKGVALLTTHFDPEHVGFSVFKDEEPIVSCHCCLEASAGERVWARVVERHRSYAETLLEQPLPEPVRAECVAMPFVRRPPGLFLTVHLQPGLYQHREFGNWVGQFEWMLYYCFWVTARSRADRPVRA